ncbi:MAG: NAD-dependent epimerase/dehydratase family protein [Myxococcaceae bacterium]
MTATQRSMEGRRVVVTGAGGFLGPHVVNAFAAEGARVFALLGPPDVSVREPEGAERLARGDVCDEKLMDELVAGADAVMHLAGPSSVSASFNDPAKFIRTHTEGTAVTLQACKSRGVRRFVYISSAEVYGRPPASPVDESQPVAARSPYGAAKIGAEKLVEAFAAAYALEAIILRPFSVYGPGAIAEALIPQLIAMAQANGRLTVRDLKPVRDYCFVGDVARAVVLAAQAKLSQAEVLNVGTGIGTSVAQVAAKVLEALGLCGDVGEAEQRDRPGASEIYELVADASRARRVLGWSPRVSLDEGLRLTIRGQT